MVGVEQRADKKEELPQKEQDEDWNPILEADAVDDSVVDDSRTPRMPHDPGSPAKRKIKEHGPLHWPFGSWCRHCVRGRAKASPQRRRSQEEKELETSRVPAISCDHSCLGTVEDDRSAHQIPISTIAVPPKRVKPWTAAYTTNPIAELGHRDVKVAFEIDQAKDLIQFRDAVTVAWTAPTVPPHSPVRQWKANGAMEKAVPTWRVHFRSVKS